MRRVSNRLALFAVLALSVLGFAAVGAVAKTPAKPRTVVITGGTTTIKATNATVKLLTKNGITPTAIAPATLTGTSVSLPVKGGIVRARTLNGVLLHKGAVKFSTAKKSMVLRRITLYKLGAQAHLAAVVGGKIVNLGNIINLKVKASGKTATVTGELHLTAAVARVINRLVGKHVVSGGFDFGNFTSSLTIK